MASDDDIDKAIDGIKNIINYVQGEEHENN